MVILVDKLDPGYWSTSYNLLKCAALLAFLKCTRKGEALQFTSKAERI